MAKASKQGSRKFIEAIRNNPQRIFLVLMVVLVVLKLLTSGMEETFYSSENAQPQQPALQPEITQESEDYLRVSRMAISWPEFQSSEVYALVEFNMFDPKRVRSALQIQQEVYEQIRAGRQALEGSQNYTEAMRIVRDLLNKAPNNLQVKQLRDDLVVQNIGRAESALQNQQYEEARQVLEASLDLAPEHPEADRMREMLDQALDELGVDEEQTDQEETTTDQE